MLKWLFRKPTHKVSIGDPDVEQYSVPCDCTLETDHDWGARYRTSGGAGSADPDEKYGPWGALT